MKRLAPALVLAVLLLAACRTEPEVPPPAAMTPESVGYYCQMNVLEHPGPKAQVHLKDVLDPLFFSQVRDAIAYLRMPEQAAEIDAIYVSDMAHAPSWDQPGADNWVALDKAVFVVGSSRTGGMGATETVPFSDPAAAEAFAAAYGGRVMTLDQIPDSQILLATDKPDATPSAGPEGGEDYAARLRALAQPAESQP